MKVQRVDQPSPPGWVHELMGVGSIKNANEVRDAFTVGTTASKNFTLVKIAVTISPEISDRDFHKLVVEAYREIFKAIDDHATPSLLRLWNFIPNIYTQFNSNLDRYMVFNAARYEAYDRWLTPTQRPPVATAVGHAGEELILFALAGKNAGITLENPRQIPAYQYSQRYGPRPPAFSRGSIVQLCWHENPALILLISGTASVVGEDSQHATSLENQIRELGVNLENLCAVALGSGKSKNNSLEIIRALRAYVVHEKDQHCVENALKNLCPRLESLEVMTADICRRELMVEVEGIALLDP